ncbi:MAG: hypothetical protein COB59_10155 [Rhodospirillaceae bacterium]|nr:MAG: hypothetical protein COB59_10155 [Rhodospirillaceae bacterium]
MRLIGLFLFGCFVLLGAGEVFAQAKFYQCDNKMYLHRDVVILGFPCTQNANRSEVSTQVGVEKIIAAIDLLALQSPESLNIIKRLKKAGPVIIIYDPAYPPVGQNLTTVQQALFLPTFVEKFDQDKTGKKFTVIVSRNGIKQSLQTLAAVLVHELMGHGTQHLEDRILVMRTLDVECEAWLLEEQVYQDFAVDKLSRDMVLFRQNLEQIHCSDFINYMRNRVPDQVKLWDAKNPDVTKLLAIFKGFLKAQHEKGMISTALAAAQNQRATAIQKVAREGHPNDLYALGKMYMAGIGEPENPVEAAIWYEKAAAKKHSGAELALAELYENGKGVKPNLKRAMDLYVRAAKQGEAEAFYALGVMFEVGRGVKKDLKKSQALYVRARAGVNTNPLVTFGMMYNDGTGFVQNVKKAHAFFLKAARLGHKAAQFELGLLLEQGIGVAKNITLAAAWIKKSAAQGYAPAQQHN